jgi:hypothetical protein
MPRQQHEQHQHHQGTVNSTLFDLDDIFLGAKDEESGQQQGDVTFKDQVREDLLSASLATAAAAATPPRGRVAAATDIPMVNAVAVSASQISAEAEEDRLRDVERRAAAAAAEAAAEAVRDQVAQLEQKLAAVRAPPRSGNRHDVSDTEYFDGDNGYDVDRLQDAERRAATAEAARRDQEVRLAQVERQLAAVLPPPPQKVRNIGGLKDVRLEVQNGNANDDNVEDNVSGKQLQRHQPQQKTQKKDDIANKGNNNSSGSSPEQLSQGRRRRRRCIVVVVVAVLIAAAAVMAGICGTGRCSSPTPSPVSPPVPSSMSITASARARADTILPFINSITLSGRTFKYPSSSSPEERAVRWLVEDDLGTAVDDKQSLRQRYVLGTLWSLQPTPTTDGFGSADHKLATTWTTNIDECEWLDVECDGKGVVTALPLQNNNVRGKIPPDLGLLTDLTNLKLSENQLSGTIPSFLGALTALTELYLYKNQLSGSIPSSLGALTALTDLALHINLLDGTIPSSLGALTALSWLFLHDNQLVGTMPFCNSDQSFSYFIADCAKVNCTCCTGCCPTAFGSIPVSELCDN